jgi:hypothetical protein
MGVYDRQIATAARLIAAKGQLCMWREPGTPTGPANIPVEGVPADYPVSIVFLSNSKNEGLAGLLSMFRDLPDVPTGGMRGLMAAVPFTPSLMGRVARATTFAEPALNIMDDKGIDVLNVNGEIILYYLRFAR